VVEAVVVTLATVGVIVTVVRLVDVTCESSDVVVVAGVFVGDLVANTSPNALQKVAYVAATANL
jgi:hypothetical protein